MRHAHGMGRVRLNAGGLSAAQVRMGSRGASERLRPLGDDINSSDGTDTRLICGWCGSTKKVDTSRPRRCAPCRADEEIVRDATARLQKAGQPPLGASVGSKADFAKIRKQGVAARARLAERRRAAPRPAPKPPAKLARATPSSPRRINAAQKQAGARRLRAKIEQMEKELKAMSQTDKRRDRLREDLHVARRLLSDWTEGVH